MNGASPGLVFSIGGFAPFADRLAALGGWPRGAVETRHFPDGERYQRILSDPAGQKTILVGGTIGDAETLELYDLACALAKYGAARLELIVPYFGYSTMERAVKSGEVVTAKTRARLLSAIPPAAHGNRVFFLDLHSEGIPHYLEGALAACHVYGKPFVMEAARQLAGQDFVLASTDAGRAKWVQSLAEDLAVPASFVLKRRLDDGSTRVAAVSAHVHNRHVIIYDDLIRTGGSLLQAAQAYLEAGATRVDAIATHAPLPGSSLERIRASGLIGAIHSTDSHPRAAALAGDYLTVHEAAPLFHQALLSHP